jgi:hypothetical protein
MFISEVGGTMAERIEALREEYLEECAHLFISTFNAEPWNENWTLQTAMKKLAWTIGCRGSWGSCRSTMGWLGSQRGTVSRKIKARSSTLVPYA